MSFKSAEREKLSESVSDLLFYCRIACDYLDRPLALFKLVLPNVHICLKYLSCSLEILSNNFLLLITLHYSDNST